MCSSKSPSVFGLVSIMPARYHFTTRRRLACRARLSIATIV
jgi:hypothetical protein